MALRSYSLNNYKITRNTLNTEYEQPRQHIKVKYVQQNIRNQ